MCGAPASEGSDVLDQQEAANEAQYAAYVAQAENDASWAAAANKAAATGETEMAQLFAAGHPGVVAAPVVPQTGDPVTAAFDSLAPSLGIDPNTTVPVTNQKQGNGTVVQPLDPNGTAYQMSNLNFDPNTIGTSDPSAISALFHGNGNPSWYIGGETDAIHLVDMQNPQPGFQVGLRGISTGITPRPHSSD